MDILPLDVIKAVVEHACLSRQMKHRINSAVSEQMLDSGCVTANLRVDMHDIALRFESSAQGFPDEALTAGHYCSHRLSCAVGLNVKLWHKVVE